MKKLLLGLAIAMSTTVFAQDKAYKVSTDPKNGRTVFAGPLTFSDLDGEKSFAWMSEGYSGYEPKKKPLEYIRPRLRHYDMVIFMGTWCGDSHEMIPKLKRVLDIVDYPKSQLKMYGTDRSKTTADALEKKYNIVSVPTVILYRDGKEVGRITETVHKNIEKDLADIIKTDPAKDMPQQ